jgi:hypothetical protein
MSSPSNCRSFGAIRVGFCDWIAFFRRFSALEYWFMSRLVSAMFDSARRFSCTQLQLRL